MSKAVVASLAVVATAAAFGGCSQLLGLDTYHTTDDARLGDARIRFAIPELDACMKAECGTLLDECGVDPACHEQGSCYASCAGDDKNACMYRCLSRAWEKQVAPTFKSIVQCAVLHCTGSGIACGMPFAGQGEGCGDCVESDHLAGGLCDLVNQCMSDSQCRGYLACEAGQCDETGETDPRCRMYCGAQFPEAARTFYQTVGTRYFSGCRAQCEGGQHWRCPQQPIWPPNAANLNLTLRLSAFSSPAVATVCNPTDYGCVHPLYPTSFDASAPPDGAVSSDAGADVHFVLPPAPNGAIIDVRPSDPAAFEVLFVPQQPLTGDVLLWVPNPAPPGLDSAAAQRGDPPVDLVSHGLVYVAVADCDGGLADFGSNSPRITLSANTGSAAYYNGDPAAKAPAIAWFINVPPDSTSITLMLDGKQIQNTRVPVRAGAITVVSFNYPQWL